MKIIAGRIKSLARGSAAAVLLMLQGGAAPLALAEGGEAPVPRITLYSGDAITNEVLADRRLAPGAANAGAVFQSREAVVGKVARRTLTAGHPIPVNALREPYVVTQGSPVQIVFETSGLTITARGLALQSGGAGEAVQVRNVSSGATITGIARPDGSVQVGMR